MGKSGFKRSDGLYTILGFMDSGRSPALSNISTKRIFSWPLYMGGCVTIMVPFLDPYYGT